MNNPQNILVSYFTHLKAQECINVNLLDELMRIKNGHYKSLTNTGRDLKLQDELKYKEFKKHLPIVTFGGTFSGSHALSNLVVYNNLLVLDIDDISLEKIAELRVFLEKDDYIFSFWISPSGYGIKGLIRIGNDITAHKQVFEFFKNYFLEKYDIILDKSGCNVNRTCFVSYDENLYLNVNSKVFVLDNDLLLKNFKKNGSIARKKNNTTESNDKVFKITFGLNKYNDKLLITNVIKYLKKNNKSITNSHEKWYQCAYAISKTFSYDIGYKYYMDLCELDGVKFDMNASIDKLKYCYRNKNIESGVNFSTLIHFAEEVGFKVPFKKAI